MHDFSTELISRYLDGDVSAAERRQVDELLASNANAQSFYQELRELSSGLHALPKVKSPQDLAASVLKEIQQKQPAKKPAATAVGTSQPIVRPIAMASRDLPSRRWVWNSQSWPNAAAAAAVLLAAVTYMLAGPFPSGQSGEVAMLLEADEASMQRDDIGGENDRRRELERQELKRAVPGQFGAEPEVEALADIEGKSGRAAAGSKDDEVLPEFANQLGQIPANRNANNVGTASLADNFHSSQTNKQVGQQNADSGSGEGSGIAQGGFGTANQAQSGSQTRLNADGKRESRGGRGAPQAAFRVTDEGNEQSESADIDAKDKEAKAKAPDAVFGGGWGTERFALAQPQEGLSIVEVTVDEAAWRNESFRALLEEQEIVWAEPAAGQDRPAIDATLGRDAKSLESQRKERAQISRGLIDGDEKRGETNEARIPTEDVQLVYVEAEREQLQQVLSVLKSQPPAESVYGGLSMTENQGVRFQSEAEVPAENHKYAELGQQIYNYYFREAHIAESENLDRDVGVIAGGGGGAELAAGAATRGDSSQVDNDAQGAERQQQGGSDANNAQGKAGPGVRSDAEIAGAATSDAPQGSYFQRLDPAFVNHAWMFEWLRQTGRGPSIRSLSSAERDRAGQPNESGAEGNSVQPTAGGQIDGATTLPQRLGGRGRAGEELALSSAVELQSAVDSRQRILFVLRKAQLDEPPLRAPDPSRQ